MQLTTVQHRPGEAREMCVTFAHWSFSGGHGTTPEKSTYYSARRQEIGRLRHLVRAVRTVNASQEEQS